MNVILTLFSCLAISMCCFAQGDAPCNDSFCFCVGDVVCESGECTQFPPAGCTTSTFTVPCTAKYKFVAKVICSSPTDPCENCESCVYIYPTADPNNIVGRCHTTRCDLGDCAYTCSVVLTASVNYTLAVCLVPCPNSTCDDCHDSCKAYGCVYRNVTYECVPL